VGTEIRVRGAADVTDAELHVYADGTSGDDANDGRTVGTPKKTLSAVFALIPEVIKHNTAVHLSGIFTDPGQNYFTRVFLNYPTLIIDGGDTLIQVAGPFMTTGASTTTLVVAGAGWTPDAWAGYIVEITSGVQSSKMVTVQGHTADTITPCKNWSSSPGVGTTFRIVKPATEFVGTTLSSLSISGCSGFGYIRIQRLSMSGALMCLEINSSTVSVYMGCLVDLATYYNQSIRTNKTQIAAFVASASDPSTFTSLPNNVAGVGVITDGVFLRESLGSSVQGSFLKRIDIQSGVIGAPYFAFARGARVNYANIADSRDSLSGLDPATSASIENTSGYATTKFDNSSGVGLRLVNSNLSIKGGDFSNNASHGIECINSSIKMIGAVVGTGNAGAGVYAHTHSAVRTKAGSPPTLTGTLGDCSTDGTTQATTWADVEAGSPVSDLNEMTTIEAE
jgi:hypothetical protein